jgi:hypothetical protein
MRGARERRVRWNLASRLAALDPDGCSIDEARQLRAKLKVPSPDAGRSAFVHPTRPAAAE